MSAGHAGPGGLAPVNPFLEQGLASLKKQEWLKAEKMLTKAIAMQPKNASIYDSRARAYVKLEKFDKALDDASNVVRLEPNNALGYLRTGRIMWKQGNKEGALKVFRLGKNKAASGDKYLPELEKCLEDAIRQLGGGVTKKPAIRPSTSTSAEASQTTTGKLVPDIHDLPPELLATVFGLLPLRERMRCLRVCKRWRTAATEDKRLWQVWDLSGYPRAANNAVIQFIATRAKVLLKELVIPSAKLLEDKGLNWIMVQRCYALNSLTIRENTRLSPKGLGSVIKFVGNHLKNLDLAHIRAADDIAIGAVFKFCPGLESLSLSGDCPFSTAAFAADRGKLPLRKFAVSRCNGFNDAAFAGLLAMCAGTLEDISITDCSRVGRLSLVNLANAENLKRISLDRLNFTDPPHVTLEDALLSLGDKCKKLSNFTLSYCPDVPDQALANFIGLTGDTFEELVLHYNARIGDATAQAIAAHCTILETLSLSHCPRVTEEGLLGTIGATRKTLRNLSISASPVVDDTVIETICAQCFELQWLNVSKCRAITTRGVSAMVRGKQGKAWNYVNLDDCDKVASEVVQLLAKAVKQQTGGSVSAKMS